MRILIRIQLFTLLRVQIWVKLPTVMRNPGRGGGGTGLGVVRSRLIGRSESKPIFSPPSPWTAVYSLAVPVWSCWKTLQERWSLQDGGSRLPPAPGLPRALEQEPSQEAPTAWQQREQCKSAFLLYISKKIKNKNKSLRSDRLRILWNFWYTCECLSEWPWCGIISWPRSSMTRGHRDIKFRIFQFLP